MFFHDMEYLLTQTCSTHKPKLDRVEYLIRYVQLVLESLYIFTSLKTSFALHLVIHHCFVDHLIIVSMIVWHHWSEV